MVEVEDFGGEILSQDSDHPNLGILEETSWSEVESVFVQSIAKGAFHFVDIRLMHVYYLLLILLIY